MNEITGQLVEKYPISVAFTHKFIFDPRRVGMNMKKLAVLALCGAVSGCGTYLPGLTSETVLPLGALTDKIDCEFRNAVYYQLYVRKRKLHDWQAGYTVTVKSNEVGGAKASSNSVPATLSPLWFVTIGYGAGASTTANRTAILKFGLDFSEVKQHQRPNCALRTSDSLHPFFTGEIGFAEWMDRAFSTNAPINSLGHTFEFSLEITAGASGEFKIGIVDPKSVLSPGVTLSRVDDNIVEVAMAPAPPKETTTKTILALSQQQEQEIQKILQQIAELRKLIEDSNKKRISTLTVDPIASAKYLEEVRSYNNQITNLRQQAEAIRNSAARTTTTVSRPVPADRNLLINSTQQQLTIERLNNALRVR